MLLSSPRSSRLSPSRRVCPLSHVKRERGRARSRRSPPRFVWLSLIQLRGPDSLKDISSYREASIKLSDPLSLIVTDLKASVKRPHHSTRRSPQSRRSPRSRRSHDRSGTPNRPKRARQRAALTAQTSRSPIKGQEGAARASPHACGVRRAARARAPPPSTRGLLSHEWSALMTGASSSSQKGGLLSRAPRGLLLISKGDLPSPQLRFPPPRGRARAPRGACAVRAA